MESKLDGDLKAGWKTTEFWSPIIALVVSALVLTHTIPGGDQANVTNMLTALVSAVIGLGGPIVLIAAYIRSRINAKAALLKMAADDMQHARNLQLLARDSAATAAPVAAAPDGAAK